MSQAKRAPALVLALLLAALTLFFVQPATAGSTGTISGTITLAGGSGELRNTYGNIQVLNGSTWTYVGELVEPDYTGQYVTEPLLPGTYRIEFTNFDYRALTTNPVNVTADTTVVIDVVLDPGANIQGRFITPAGGPAIDGGVHVMEEGPIPGYWHEVDKAFMEPDGTYYVSGLAGGNYKVWFGDIKAYYAIEYYDNVATLDQARVLTVPSGSSVTNIDVLVSHEPLPVPPPPAPPAPPVPPVATPTNVTISHGPHIFGKMRVGQRVKATIGTVTPASATVRYAWLLDGRRIKTATKRSLRLEPAMRGRQLSLKVLATAPGLQRWVKTTSGKEVRGAR